MKKQMILQDCDNDKDSLMYLFCLVSTTSCAKVHRKDFV